MDKILTCIKGMSASIGRPDDARANTTRFTSTSSEMAQHDGSAGVEDLPQDVTRHENIKKKKKPLFVERKIAP